jgi:hypothetical protein
VLSYWSLTLIISELLCDSKKTSLIDDVSPQWS